MSDTMTASKFTGQWLQFYEQPLMDGGFSDATVVTRSPTMSSDSILSPSNSYSTNGQLTPKGNVSKPIRRRYRVSKRTPTTLLNANTSNFRALVQQFTGCPSTAMPFGIHKGPIILNFQQGGQQIQHNTSKIMLPSANKSVSYDQVYPVYGSLPQQKQPEHQQQLQQSGHSSSVGDSRLSMEVFDGLLMDNDFSLQDLTMNYTFSTDIMKDGYFI